MSETLENIQNLSTYETEVHPTRLLLIPRDPENPVPVCELLWSEANRPDLRRADKLSFTLTLFDPVSERPETITICCVSGGVLNTDWNTTYRFEHLEDSGHPCNTPRPPCLGQPTETSEVPPDPDQPYVAPPTLWKRICVFFSPRRNNSSTRESSEPFPKDKEIPDLALLRSSARIAPDLWAFRVILEKHYRADQSGQRRLFMITLSFGRCGQGENMLFFRCQDRDHDGLRFTTE